MLELLQQRRSVRTYKPQPVEPEKIATLSEALLRAPTSRNFQPCEFVLVDDPKKLQQLATAKSHGTSFFASAPLAVVIAADPTVSDVWVGLLNCSHYCAAGCREFGSEKLLGAVAFA
jgi:nitroreductase